jgi:NADH:ubiquinone oxidoreductase subunit E
MTSTTATDNWEQVRESCRAALTEDIVRYIEACRESPEPASRLISVLHRVQEHFGHLGTEQLDAVAQLLGVPAAKVGGVASFYHFFRLQPQGRFMISVCMGTACYVKGADKVAAKFKDELGIDFGQTTSDGRFSLHVAHCVGTCGLAPVVMINDEVHAKVTPDQVPALLEKTAACIGSEA